MLVTKLLSKQFMSNSMTKSKDIAARHNI